MLCGAAQRCLRRRLIVVQVSLFTVIAVVIIGAKLHRLLVHWQLLKLAGDRRLLTFHSTQNWGIGNCMFGFASTLAISRTDSSDLPLPLCFDKHLPLRAAFSPLAEWPVCSPHDVLELLNAEHLKEEAYARYDRKLVHNLPRDRHVVLNRFLQSWRYFANIEAELRRLFRFDESVWEAASSALKVAVGDDAGDVLKIGLHVRRGDIVQQEERKQDGYVVADMSYIERAMDYMDQHLHVNNNTGTDDAGRRRLFIVCSNDKVWCLENLPTHRLRHMEFLSTHDPIIDLAILAMCQHTIITVGTFGWWAAWLANGTTVYYKDWPRAGSRLAAATSHADYFPPHWIPL